MGKSPRWQESRQATDLRALNFQIASQQRKGKEQQAAKFQRRPQQEVMSPLPATSPAANQRKKTGPIPAIAAAPPAIGSIYGHSPTTTSPTKHSPVSAKLGGTAERFYEY